MQRRLFVKSVLATTALHSFVPFTSVANPADAKKKKDLATPWTELELKTKVETSGTGAHQLWIPLPLESTSYQESLANQFQGNFNKAQIVRDPVYGAPVLFAEWTAAGPMNLQLTSKVRVRDRKEPELATAEDRKLYLKPTRHVPNGGLVLETAAKIVGTQSNPDLKARQIYDWMIDHTFRDPKVRGCGVGDVESLLKSGALGGKCADLSSLFVGLCRAVGVPAREMFGLRALPSAIAPSIGKVGDVSKAQHCRAEFMTSDNRWFPVDPADVRKVILEEKLGLKDPRVQMLREKLYGFWEMNWVAFNSARDFKLPSSKSEEANYLMYPLLVSSSARKDGMDPETFKYTIESVRSA